MSDSENLPRPRIILASSSPRRQMLMRQACIPFEAIPSNVDEALGEAVSPYEVVKMLSAKKAMHALAQVQEPAVIIAADTIVSMHGRVLGKPTDAGNAFDMLKLLQGKQHSVYTGVTLIQVNEDGYTLKHIVDTASVFMRTLTDREISAYIATGEPFDKAGAYAVQEKGSLLIERIEGDYNTIVGLPLTKINLALLAWGIDVAAYWL